MAEHDAVTDIQNEFDSLVQQGVEHARDADKPRWRNQGLLDAFEHPYRLEKFSSEVDFFKYFHKKANVPETEFKSWRSNAKAFQFALRAESVLFEEARTRGLLLSYGAAVALKVYDPLDESQLQSVLQEFFSQPQEYGIKRRMDQVHQKFPQPQPADGSGRQRVAGRKRSRQSAEAGTVAGDVSAAAEHDADATDSDMIGDDQVQDSDHQGSQTEDDDPGLPADDNNVGCDLMAMAEARCDQEAERVMALEDQIADLHQQLLEERTNSSRLQASLEAEQRKSSRLESSLEAANEELQVQQQNSSNLQSSLKKARADLHEEQQNSSSLQSSLDKANAELQDEQQKGKHLQISLNTAQALLRTEQQKSSNLQTRLNQAGANLQAEQQKSSRLQASLSAAETDLQAQKQKHQVYKISAAREFNQLLQRAACLNGTLLAPISPPGSVQLPMLSKQPVARPCAEDFKDYIPSAMACLRWAAQPANLSHEAAAEQLIGTFTAAAHQQAQLQLDKHSEAIEQLKVALASGRTIAQVHRLAEAFKDFVTHAELVSIITNRPKQAQEASAPSTPAADSGHDGRCTSETETEATAMQAAAAAVDAEGAGAGTSAAYGQQAVATPTSSV